MANTRSAKKMVRKIAKRTALNKDQRTRMRTYVRRVEDALASGDKAAAHTALCAAQPFIARAGRKGLIHHRTAARKVSRLARRVNML